MKKILKTSQGKLATVSLFVVLLTFTSCKKFLVVPAPQTSLNSADVYATDATAISVLTGLYVTMSQGNTFTGNGSISEYAGLSADEFTLYNGVATNDNQYYFYTNSLFTSKLKESNPLIWYQLYSSIFTCNAAIDGLNASKVLNAGVKQQLLGEAFFMRGFFYFYLVNLYGNVPLILSTDFKISDVAPNAQVTTLYTQIISDLKTAQKLLSNNYLDATLLQGTSERVRPTKGAATALLARAYLYKGDYAGAAAQASIVIANSGLYMIDSLNKVFLKNSDEAIWQIQPTNSQHNTEDGWLFILPSTGPANGNYPVYLSQSLLNTFESGDLRKTNWVSDVTAGGVTYYFPFKYKSAALNAPLTEYLMVLRLGEQYLIRAEAEANGAGGGLQSALVDLNVIRKRAGLSVYSGTVSKEALNNAILHERRVELFTEWGHRWLDLKRTQTINAVMGPPGNACQAKGGVWSSYKQLYPIPFHDINTDPHLNQNPGY